MLSVAPVVMRLVVKRIENRDKHQELAFVSQGSMHVPYRRIEIKDMLEHIEAYNDIIFIFELHCGYVQYFVGEFRNDVCTFKPVACMELVLYRIDIFAIHGLAGADFENPFAFNPAAIFCHEFALGCVRPNDQMYNVSCEILDAWHARLVMEIIKKGMFLGEVEGDNQHACNMKIISFIKSIW